MHDVCGRTEAGLHVFMRQAVDASQLTITVGIVEFKTPYKRERHGLCTSWLAELPAGMRRFWSWMSRTRRGHSACRCTIPPPHPPPPKTTTTVFATGPKCSPQGSIRMAVHNKRGGVTPAPPPPGHAPPPPPDHSDQNGKKRNLPLGKSCRGLLGTPTFGSQAPPFQYVPGSPPLRPTRNGLGKR